ncbi:MAG: Imidazoleglycerol-phosphate dehydratase [Phycisphaerales bacterium]|jgi:imidazoleglycerol-phosphate dehydratase|nr:Imidazoleglycerol-phosphate dehydratase [Phycisphaerales bacterium]MDB5355384.1 Imidazoleglycerol-phosphate dehydratase [Phycisphaerales bacterium]
MANVSGRKAEISRQTKETKVRVAIDLDGAGRTAPHTGVGFFDHMLDLLGRHSLIDLEVEAEGDLQVDAHHTVEDVGIVLGQALEQALGDKRGIQRYGWAIVPMDESLAQVAIDLSGRPAFVFNVQFKGEAIGAFPVELVEEFFKAIATTAKLNLHVTVPYGSNNHHISEAIFKATARALRQAVSLDPRNDQVPSTKGSLQG